MTIRKTMAMIGEFVGEFITAQVGLVLYGAVAAAELGMQRWYGGAVSAGGFV